MSETEKDIEQYLRRRVEQAGGRCVKFVPDFKRGWPDRIILLPAGTLVWVELKRPSGGRVASAQRVAHEDLRRLGQRVELVFTKAEVDALISECVRG